MREQYEKELQETREALGDAHLQIYALKKYRRLLDDEENSQGKSTMPSLFDQEIIKIGLTFAESTLIFLKYICECAIILASFFQRLI